MVASRPPYESPCVSATSATNEASSADAISALDAMAAECNDISFPFCRSGNPAVFEGRRIDGGCEILGVSANLISDACRLRVFDSCRPRHYGIASLVRVVFTARASLHLCFSLSATTGKRSLCASVSPRSPSCPFLWFHPEHLG
jgi:hypothetical protein